MGDLMKEANYLRYFYTSDEASKDKDWNKNATFEQYVNKVGLLFTFPLAFQAW